MVREHNEGLGSLLRLGVVEGQPAAGFGLGQDMMKGSYIKSNPHPSRVWMPSPVPGGKPYHMHNFEPHKELDHESRAAVDLEGETPLTMPFDARTIVNARNLLSLFKQHGTRFLALSGTCPEAVRKVLIDEFKFEFSGELTIPRPLEMLALRGVPSHERLVRESLDLRAEMSKRGKRGFVNAMINSPQVYKLLRADAEKAGLRVSVQVEPLGQVKEGELWMIEASKDRNMEAFEKGEIDLVIWLGADFRGVDLNHSAYKGGIIKTFYTDVHESGPSAITQGNGRTMPLRTKGIETFYYGLVEYGTLKEHVNYGEAFKSFEGRVQEALRATKKGQGPADAAKWKALVEGLKRAEPPKGLVLELRTSADPDRAAEKGVFESALAAGKSEAEAYELAQIHQLRTDPMLNNFKVFMEEILAVGKSHGTMSEAQAYQMLQMLKYPKTFNGTTYRECLAAFKVRNSLRVRAAEGVQGTKGFKAGFSEAEQKALIAALRDRKRAMPR